MAKKRVTIAEWERRWNALRRYLRVEANAFEKLSLHGGAVEKACAKELRYVLIKMREEERGDPQ